MIFTLLMSFFSLSLDLLAIMGIAKSDKDLEIIILRQQARILQRKVKTPPRISDPERMVLAILMKKYCQFKSNKTRIHILLDESAFRLNRMEYLHQTAYPKARSSGRIVHDYYRQPPAENHAYG